MNDICARQDHKSLYRQLVAGMYDALLVTDPNGHMIELNPRATEYFQCGQEDVWDKPVSMLIPGVTAEMVNRIRKGLDEARHIMLDAQCQRKDGSWFSAEVTISIIDLVNSGDLVFTLRDTERRLRQWQALRSQANAFDNALSAGFVCDVECTFRAVNRAFLKMFDFAGEEDVLGCLFQEVMPDEPLPEHFGRALTGELTVCRVAAQTDSGERADVEVQLAPDTHANGKIIGVVGSIVRV